MKNGFESLDELFNWAFHRNVPINQIISFEAKEEVERLARLGVQLEAAIKDHAAQREDDRCFLDDLVLYRLAGINEHPGLALPKESFLSNCSRYWECQQTGIEYRTEE